MSETCRVIINQVKQKLHLVGYLPIQNAGSLNLGSGGGKGTDFASTIYPWGQNSYYPLDRRVAQSNRPHCRAGHAGKENNAVTAGNRVPVLHSVAWHTRIID